MRVVAARRILVCMNPELQGFGVSLELFTSLLHILLLLPNRPHFDIPPPPSVRNVLCFLFCSEQRLEAIQSKFSREGVDERRDSEN